MPFQAGAILGDPWAYCDRCDWQYRTSKLKMQNNLLLCSKCVDNPKQMLRDERVADILGDGKVEAENVTARIRQEPNIVKEH